MHFILANNFGTSGNNLAKLVHVMCYEAGIKNWVQILGAPHSKNLVGQNVQNLARFRTTLYFDREYLSIGSRYEQDI